MKLLQKFSLLKKLDPTILARYRSIFVGISIIVITSGIVFASSVPNEPVTPSQMWGMIATFTTVLAGTLVYVLARKLRSNRHHNHVHNHNAVVAMDLSKIEEIMIRDMKFIRDDIAELKKDLMEGLESNKARTEQIAARTHDLSGQIHILVGKFSMLKCVHGSCDVL